MHRSTKVTNHEINDIMNPLAALFEADRIAFKRWFRTQTVSKLIVFGLFLLVFSAIAVVIYTVSNFFFRNLATFPPYGPDTAFYLLHAALMTVSWFAIASAMIAAAGFLLGNNAQLEYLLGLPVRPLDIARWFFGKTVIINCVILVFLLSPVIFAYSVAFQGGVAGPIALRFVLVAILLVLSINSIGVLVGYTLAPLVNRHKRISAIAMFFIFLGVSVLLLRFMFPPVMNRLYSADPVQFYAIYNSLPLSNTWLPTYWLTRTVTSGLSLPTLYSAVITVVLLILAERLQITRLLPLWQTLHSQEQQLTASAIVNHESRMFSTKNPLIRKDISSILRTPSELGYAIFLIGLAAFFFVLLVYFSRLKLEGFKYQKELLLFSFVWLMFFATTLYLRLVFPLLARESRSIWYIFSLPLSRLEVVKAKVKTGLWICLPLCIISVLMWMIYPFAIEGRALFISASIMALVTLSIAHAYLGSIFPAFELGEEPEKVSTTTMGIATLAVSFFIGGFITFVLYAAINGMISTQTAYLVTFAFAVVTLLNLKFLSRLSVASYKL